MKVSNEWRKSIIIEKNILYLKVVSYLGRTLGALKVGKQVFLK